MSTPATPVVAAPAKVSWLKKLGLDILKFLSIASPIEKVAEPIVEALVPVSAIAFNLFDYAVAQVTNIEAAYAQITTAPSGVAKAQATISAIENAIDQWVTANMPGSQGILTAAAYVSARLTLAQNMSNGIVTFLNQLPAPASTMTTASALSVATTMKAIVAANPTVAKDLVLAVTTGKKA